MAVRYSARAPPPSIALSSKIPISLAIRQVGPYMLGPSLGEGSFGKVKLGIHQATGEKVAIKIIEKSMLDNKKSLRRQVDREIGILLLLNHKNIMKLIDVYETPRYLFLVQEFISGGELFELVASAGALDEVSARQYFRELVQTVHYCHKHFICHRDLKLENVMIAEDHSLKLIDFGMACVASPGQFLRKSCGSPHYAAPEVISGKPYSGPLADSWSLGVVLYAFVTGCLPFDHDQLPVLFERIAQGVFRIPKGLSKELVDLLCRMICTNPEQRMSLENVLQHPWMQVEDMDYPAIDQLVLDETPLLDEEIDDNIAGKLVRLFDRMSQEELHEELRNQSPSVPRTYYRLLKQTSAEFQK